MTKHTELRAIKTQPDISYIRSELDRLVRRLSVSQMTIANAETLKLVAECQPDDKFYLWQANDKSPVEDALNSLQQLNGLLNPDGRPRTTIIPISVLESPMQKLKSCVYRLQTIKSFATVMTFALAYQQGNETGNNAYEDVADYISDQLETVTTELDDLVTHIGHRMI